MKIKTSELSGAQLDWAVAKCEIPNDVRDNRPCFWVHPNNPRLICQQTYNHDANPKGYKLFQPSTDWTIGGPIIAREKIDTSSTDSVVWIAIIALIENEELVIKGGQTGNTLLEAAMRCYVEFRLGAEVEVPNELS